MARFIPEWQKASAREMQIKRVLGALDDAYVIRRPIRAGTSTSRLPPVDLFIQHDHGAWLALSIETAPFAELDPAQLFASPVRSEFELRLERLRHLPGRLDRGQVDIPSLVLMWSCSTEEVRKLRRDTVGGPGVKLASREEFSQRGAELVAGSVTPMAIGIQQALLAEYFPEAEIAPACTARRSFHRDNNAQFQRMFLDLEQEWATKLDLELPTEQAAAAAEFSVRLVNGVAGSGKTLIAIHRARLLAELFPNQRILTLIHNTPIVADLKARLHDAHGGLPANVEIQTFFAWIYGQWRHAFGTPPRMPEDPAAVPELVRRHRLSCPGLRQSDSQILSELDFINEALLTDEAAYMAASRTGRGFALRPAERSQMWTLYQAITRSLRDHGQRMWSALPRELCAIDIPLRTYEHILVDEAQFFAPSWFQVVKRSLAPQGQLFMCADPNQGFMKSRLSWKSVGLDVAGRTKRLRRSYRTTRRLLEAATNVLTLLGFNPSDDYLRPDYDGMAVGNKPLLAYTASPQDTIDRLVAELAACTRDAQIPSAACLVIYGDNVHKQSLYKNLTWNFGVDRVWWLNEQSQKKAPPNGYGQDYLRMAYIDTATGLEAAIVFLVGIESLFSAAHAPGSDDDELAELHEETARKLYMAMTRAGQRLVVLASQRLPAAMEALFEKT